MPDVQPRGLWHDRRMDTTTTSIGTDHPDAIIYRRAADAFRAGDLETLAETIHPDVVWHLPGSTWFARELEGRGELLAYLGEVVERTSGTFALQDVVVSGTDDHVVSVQRFGATIDGRTEYFDVTSILHYVDGLQVERWFHFHDLAAFDEFFGRF